MKGKNLFITQQSSVPTRIKSSKSNNQQQDKFGQFEDDEFSQQDYQKYLRENEKYETNPYMKDISQKECDEFQKKLDNKYIQRIWKSFRESGNSDSGKIQRQVFKKVFINIIDDTVREVFLDALFERFKLEKLSEKYEEGEQNRFGNQMITNDTEKVDIQDLVISLTILARMSEQNKLNLIFILTDVDEDECLSTEDIRKMIQRIERNFTREQSHIDSESSCLAQEFALNKSQRRYQWTLCNLSSKEQKDQNKDNSKQEGEKDENKLITWSEFDESLKNKTLKNCFLPNNYLLYHCLVINFIQQLYLFEYQNCNDNFIMNSQILLSIQNNLILTQNNNFPKYDYQICKMPQ